MVIKNEKTYNALEHNEYLVVVNEEKGIGVLVDRHGNVIDIDSYEGKPSDKFYFYDFYRFAYPNGDNFLVDNKDKSQTEYYTGDDDGNIQNSGFFTKSPSLQALIRKYIFRIQDVSIQGNSSFIGLKGQKEVIFNGMHLMFYGNLLNFNSSENIGAYGANVSTDSSMGKAGIELMGENGHLNLYFNLLEPLGSGNVSTLPDKKSNVSYGGYLISAHVEGKYQVLNEQISGKGEVGIGKVVGKNRFYRSKDGTAIGFYISQKKVGGGIEVTVNTTDDAGKKNQYDKENTKYK